MRIDDWRPYPKVKPPKEEKMYLVTYKTRTGELDVCTDFYYESEEVRDCYSNIVIPKGWRFNEFVTAWAEMPSAYKGEANARCK